MVRARLQRRSISRDAWRTWEVSGAVYIEIASTDSHSLWYKNNTYVGT